MFLILWSINPPTQSPKYGETMGGKNIHHNSVSNTTNKMQLEWPAMQTWLKKRYYPHFTGSYADERSRENLV